MPNELKSQTFAQGRVTAAGALAVPGPRAGNFAVVLTAPGIYTITWVGAQIDPTKAIYKVWPRGGVAALRETAKVSNDAVDVNDAFFVVRTYNAAGAASNVEFDFEVSQTP